MGKMEEPTFEPMLPKWRSIAESKCSVDEKVRSVASFAGFRITSHGISESPRAERGRYACSELALRWLLETMKKCGAEPEMSLSANTWKLMRCLVLKLPVAVVARLLNANPILSIVNTTLQHALDTLKSGVLENGSSAKPVTLPPSGKSLKRKRGEEQSKEKELQHLISTLGAVIDTFISMSLSKNVQLHGHNVVSSEHMKSVLQTSSLEAAQILGSWLRYLSIMYKSEQRLDSRIEDDAGMRDLSPALKIWELRLHEIDDDLGSSAVTFSKECLLPAVKLYSRVATRAKATSSQHVKVKTELEELFARHLLVPARTSFSAMSKDRKKKNSSGAESQLLQNLQPLRDEIAQASDLDKQALLRILPFFLEEAIKLCPTSSPKEKAAETPWIENVFVLLSYCATEHNPSVAPVLTVTNNSSPIANLLKVIHLRKISLSTDLLETVLINYSGLINPGEQNLEPQWPLISMLLCLDSSIFLQKGDTESATQHRKYVNALLWGLSRTKWSPDTGVHCGSDGLLTEPKLEDASYPFHVFWDNKRRTAAEQILVPLMQGYASARELGSFMSLWFRELRSDWKDLGTPGEKSLPWAAEELRHAFSDLLGDSLTAAKIDERIVEYVLPLTVLADEVSMKPSGPIDWVSLSAIAPASAAFFMLELLLLSVDRVETFQQYAATWMSLKELMLRYTTFDMSQFRSSSRVWTILTWLNGLAARVESAESISSQKSKLLASGVVETALSVISSGVANSVSSPQYTAGLEAFRFVVLVCSEMLDLPDLNSKAEACINAANSTVLKSSSTQSSEEEAVRFYDHAIVLVQCPRLFQLLTSERRRGLFSSLFQLAVIERKNLSEATSPIVYPENGSMQFQTLFTAIVECLLATGLSGARDDFVQIIADQFPHDGSILEVVDLIAVEMALDIILELPASVITRKDRETILDRISESLQSNNKSARQHEALKLHGHDLTAAAADKSLALMIRLLANANPTSKICVQADVIWSIAIAFDCRDESITKETLELLEALFIEVLNQALTDQVLERRQQFAEDFTKLAVKSVSSQHLFLNHPSSLILIKTWLSILSGVGDDMLRVASDFRDGLLLNNSGLHKNKMSTLRDWVICRCLADFPYAKLGMDQHTILEPLRKPFESACSLWDAVQEAPQKSHAQTLLSGHIDLLRAVTPLLGPTNALQFSTKFLDRTQSARDHGLILQAFSDWLKSARPVHRVEMFEILIDSGDEDERSGNLRLLHLLIKTLTFDDVQLSPRIRNSVVTLCLQMQSARNVAKFGACVASINTILRTKPWLVNQHGIDAILSALVAISSPKTTNIRAGKQHTGFIYTRLCQIAVNVILLHRKRTGGRFHLLIPLLQNLLTCLFTPHSYAVSRPSSFSPIWLHDSGTSLDATHATAYSRILTTLSSPTASSTSIRRHNATANLVDSSKMARLYAGQYVPYILMHYCSLQLKGTIAIDVKDALKGSLWSLMDIVDLEGMRGMNAGMGRDERVMWTTLYADWKRFGRSQGR